MPGRPDTGWLVATVAGAFGSFGGVGGKQLLDVHCVSEGLAQSAMDMGDSPSRQWRAVAAAVLREVAVKLGDRDRAQGLEPQSSDAGNDVVIDVVAIPGKGLGLHSRGVGIDPLSQKVGHGQRRPIDILAASGSNARFVASRFCVFFGLEAADPSWLANTGSSVRDADDIGP